MRSHDERGELNGAQGWLDDVLDFIGINFPNVDEDDYRLKGC
ncbi:hypothetical protein [Streptomyces sp. NPDC056949]